MSVEILPVATELFLQFGFKSITMDAIAHAAGISKKTLYENFATKDLLVEQAVINHKLKMNAICIENLKSAANAVEGMIKTSSLFEKMFQKINPLAIMEMQRFYPKTFKIFREKLLLQDVLFIKENIEQGIAEGLFKPDLDSELMAKYKLEMTLLILQPNLLVDENHHVFYVLQKINQHFMCGIMTPKGEKIYQKQFQKTNK